MRRKTFDILASSAGLLLAAILIVAGSLLTWAYNYVGNEVHTQLAAQDIYFPPASAFAHAKAGTEIEPVMKPYLLQYAGQELLSGNQAEAYADHFIAYHLQEIGGGKTYSQLSSESIANPKDTALAGKVDTVFKGTTLRGLLLEAYAFATMGTIAGWAAIASFIGAFLFLVLGGLGLWHASRTAPERELLGGRVSAAPATPGDVSLSGTV